MIATKPDPETSDARSPRPGRSLAPDGESTRREIVRRVVQSPTFARSERLGTLLTYVCDMALKGRGEQLNEQKIGQAVFGRSQDYDSSVDGIVRSQASRLRQRLELYYQQEGANEPVRIVIPRGGYVPLFEVQSKPVPSAPVPDLPVRPPEPGEADPAVPSGQQGRSVRMENRQQWKHWSLSLLLALALALLWVHDHRGQRPAATAPPTHPFWSHLFAGHRPTMVVAPDSGLVLFHLLSGKDVNLEQYVEGGYRSETNGPPTIGPAAAQREWLLDLANCRYTSIVDVEAILSLKDRARTLGSDVSVHYARDLRPNDFKTGSAILLGAASANPWVELFERNMNFVLKDDYTKWFWVLNRNPQNGEPPRWEAVRNDPERRVFGLVAYLPNLAGDGNALLIEGTSMAGTEAAADFVNDDAQLLPFLKRIQRPDGTLPHFELLLQTQNMGASAVRSHILAFRVTK